MSPLMVVDEGTGFGGEGTLDGVGLAVGRVVGEVVGADVGVADCCGVGEISWVGGLGIGSIGS